MNDILVTESDGVVVATFNRPTRLNACRSATYTELAAVAARFAADPAWRALVLTGAGRAFCAGQDLDDVPTELTAGNDLAERIATLQQITRLFAAAAKPTIAALNGPAVGFGLECTLAFDIRIATEAAYFLLPELARGLFHTNGTYHFLTGLVGRGMATDMILTGRRVTAHEALRAGLVSRLEDAHDLLPASMALAREMSGLNPRAVACAREGLRRGATASLEDALEFEARTCLSLLTPE